MNLGRHTATFAAHFVKQKQAKHNSAMKQTGKYDDIYATELEVEETRQNTSTSFSDPSEARVEIRTD